MADGAVARWTLDAGQVQLAQQKFHAQTKQTMSMAESKHNWYRNQFKNLGKTKNSKCCENNNVDMGQECPSSSLIPL